MAGEQEIRVEVELFGRLARKAGSEKIPLSVLDALPVRRLSSILIEKLGNEIKPDLLDSESRSTVATLVNRKHVSPDCELHDGDVVTLVPILAGG